MKKRPSKIKVYGSSPKGYNGIDYSSGDEIEVPLEYDSRVKTHISKHAIVDLDNEDIDRARHIKSRREESFRKRIGIN